MERFNRVISSHELIDLPLMGSIFTWNNNQRNDIRIVRGPSPFLFEVYWLSHPSFFSIVQNWWNTFTFSGSAGFVLSKKLQILKNKLRSWSKEEYGHIDRQLEELERKFIELDLLEDANNGLTEAEWDEKLKTRQDYCKLIILQADKWRIRAKSKFIKSNDNNTKFFHRLTTDRRRRNYIGKIRDNVSERPVMEDTGFEAIPEDVRVWLERTIDEEEVMYAIKLMGKDKAPGPDGFPDRGFLDWRLKNTFIVLIPKKETVEEIKDLRPISF
ncbi:uncharacterized protein LOC113326263 [Papaver somniferum]|uniref:uncharacterized protein LOC113326263 n=1 Tax=Papaver somniferum TaxID=3469 RepID=UPI000E70159D|nr:uncharacterized protein LOC113326263 [Papaver somniferum]